jgi:hypothetical protein
MSLVEDNYVIQQFSAKTTDFECHRWHDKEVDSHETILGANSMIFVREMLQDELYRSSEEYRLTGNVPASVPKP